MKNPLTRVILSVGERCAHVFNKKRQMLRCARKSRRYATLVILELATATKNLLLAAKEKQMLG